MFADKNKNEYMLFMPKKRHKDFYSLFTRVEEFESVIGKNITDFNTDDCYDLLRFMKVKSSDSVSKYTSELNRYIDWCIKNKLSSGRNAWKNNVSDNNTDIYKTEFEIRYLKNPEHLVSILDKSCYERRNTKLVALLLYNGLYGEKLSELRNAKEENISIIKKTLMVPERGGQIISLRDEFIKEYKFTGYDEGESRVQKLEEKSPYIIKPYLLKKRMIGNPVEYAFILVQIGKHINDRYFEETGNKINLTALTIYKSGLFYSLYELEQNVGVVTKDEYDTVMGSEKTSDAYWAFIKDYDLYKKVFWNE